MLGNLQPLTLSLPWCTSGPNKVGEAIFHLMEMCLLTGHKPFFYGGISWSVNIIFSNNLFPLFYVSVPGLGIDFLYQLPCTGLSLFIKTSLCNQNSDIRLLNILNLYQKGKMAIFRPIGTFNVWLQEHTKVLYIRVFQKNFKKSRTHQALQKDF